jgi:hypothetical protein
MERTISVSTDVFAKIWSLREEGENTEDAVLRRVLATTPRRKKLGDRAVGLERTVRLSPTTGPASVTWRDDVQAALERLNGRAHLSKIYNEVRVTRKATGRSVPVSFEPVVRRTLEENSSESQVYRGGPDLFYMPEGKGAGIWALR